MSEETKEVLSFDTMQIMEMIPHRFPFLLVDRITECVPGKYAKGYKNLTMNEQFFQGHFPGNPIMPGVLQLEAMAQCSAPILMTMPEFEGKLTLYAGVDGVRFKISLDRGIDLKWKLNLLKSKALSVKLMV